ncbi:MAG TPA: hypothetical protein VEB22_12355, partial [Phycisphaerales bacterium]|nr:hypothetical protein [Phycisphaerales bacterium]
AAGVRLIFIRDPDVIFRTSDPAATAARLSGAPGKVTILPPTSQGQLAEVYFRPDSAAMLQGPTLLTILNRRFAPAAATLPPAASREGPAGSAALGGLASAPRSPITKKPLLKPPPLSKGLKDIKRSLRGGNLPPEQ